MIAHIVAAAQNDTIGTNGELPWDIPEDMQFFKDQTAGHVVVMGRKTYDSIGKPLPKRHNIVITRNSDFKAEGAEVFSSIEDAMKRAKEVAPEWENEVYVIGGSEIYKQTIDHVDTIYLTRIHQDFAGDAIYEPVNDEVFSEVDRDVRAGVVPFTFVKYQRRS